MTFAAGQIALSSSKLFGAGMLLGGMTYQMDQNITKPAGGFGPGHAYQDAAALLNCLHIGCHEASRR
jgi:hypothetical protein